MIFDNNIILIGNRDYHKGDIYRFISNDLNKNILYIGHLVMPGGVSTKSIYDFNIDKIKENLFNIDYIVIGLETYKEIWLIDNISELIKLGKIIIIDCDIEPFYDWKDILETYKCEKYIKEQTFNVSFGNVTNYGIMLNGVKLEDIILSYKRIEKLKKLD